MTRPIDEFQVDSAALVDLAAELELIADGLSTAAGAAQTIRTDIGAYGTACQLVPVLLDGLQQLMVTGLEAAETSARDSAASLRSVAAGYDRADEDAVGRLSRPR